MPLTIEACTAQHIGDRTEQQDRVAIFGHPKTKGAMLAALADGMGGHTGGALAAEQVLHTAYNSFSAIGLGPEHVRDMLQSGITDAHDGIRLTRYTSEQDPHSTACVLIVQPGQVDWAHCGDSRIYHFRDGRLVGRTVDHSYVMTLVQRGFLTEAQAEEHPNKNVLVSCLGDKEAPRIDYGHAAPLVAGDCFLLCSDGLWAYFSDAELGKILKEMAPRQAAEFMIDAARKRAEGHGDNISLAIVRFKEVEKTPLPSLGRR
jgi:serine/threonine protein phosphatase PrpC